MGHYYECDRCKATFTNRNLHEVSYGSSDDTTSMYTNVRERAEICDECTKELKKFLSGEDLKNGKD